jgi:uncharacterized phage-associated protein
MNKTSNKTISLIQVILHRLEGGVADYWKIYKLLYFIDFENFKKTSKSITGNSYYNWEYGPMPYLPKSNYKNDNFVIDGVNQDLWHKIDDHTVQINFLAKQTESFDNDELLSIDFILDKYSKLSGKELVALTHDDVPYMMTASGEKIEYEYVYWRDSEIEKNSIEDITSLIFG